MGIITSDLKSSGPRKFWEVWESDIVPIPSETAGPALPHSLSPLPLGDVEDGVAENREGKSKGSAASPPFPPLIHILAKGKCEKCWMAPRGVLNFLLHGQAGVICFEIAADRGTQNESLMGVI